MNLTFLKKLNSFKKIIIFFILLESNKNNSQFKIKIIHEKTKKMINP